MEIVMTTIVQSYFLFIIWLISLYILLSATHYQQMLKRTQVSKIAEVLQVLWNLTMLGRKGNDSFFLIIIFINFFLIYLSLAAY